MPPRPWTGSLLPSSIRKIAVAKPGVKAKSMLYFDQSVLRVLLREPENSPRWTKLKQMLGVPIAKVLVEMNFAFTPLMVWELAELVAPNPKHPDISFRFSLLGQDESIFKLFGESRDFNLNHIEPSLDLVKRIQDRATNWKWQDTGLSQSLIRYVGTSVNKWRNTIALYFGFQNLQEPDLHPREQFDRITDKIIELWLHYREKGDNQSLYRLIHRPLAREVEQNKRRGADGDPILKRFENYLHDLKLYGDHVDLEYIHLSAAGGVFGENVLPVISFTFDDPAEVQSRLSMSGAAYHWIFRKRQAAGRSLTDLVAGHVV